MHMHLKSLNYFITSAMLHRRGQVPADDDSVATGFAG